MNMTMNVINVSRSGFLDFNLKLDSIQDLNYFHSNRIICLAKDLFIFEM